MKFFLGTLLGGFLGIIFTIVVEFVIAWLLVFRR